MKRTRRIMIGPEGSPKQLSFKVVDDIVVAVPTKNYLWALGFTSDKLIAWMASKHIPWSSYGFRNRRNEVLLFG